jgi:hypothetical protein
VQGYVVADDETLRQLWLGLAEWCRWYLANTPPEKRRPTYLNVIRGFLQQNGCAADASHKVRSLGARLDSLMNLGIPFGESGKDH